MSQRILMFINLMVPTHLMVSIFFTLISIPFDIINTLLKALKVKFDILGIGESRLRADEEPMNNMSNLLT